jgi:hypothetical protein
MEGGLSRRRAVVLSSRAKSKVLRHQEAFPQQLCDELRGAVRISMPCPRQVSEPDEPIVVNNPHQRVAAWSCCLLLVKADATQIRS